MFMTISNDNISLTILIAEIDSLPSGISTGSKEQGNQDIKSY